MSYTSGSERNLQLDDGDKLSIVENLHDTSTDLRDEIKKFLDFQELDCCGYKVFFGYRSDYDEEKDFEEFKSGADYGLHHNIFMQNHQFLVDLSEKEDNLNGMCRWRCTTPNEKSFMKNFFPRFDLGLSPTRWDWHDYYDSPEEQKRLIERCKKSLEILEDFSDMQWEKIQELGGR